MRIVGSKMESEKYSTEVYSVLTHACVNKKCDNFAGDDLNNPKVSEIVRNLISQ